MRRIHYGIKLNRYKKQWENIYSVFPKLLMVILFVLNLVGCLSLIFLLKEDLIGGVVLFCCLNVVFSKKFTMLFEKLLFKINTNLHIVVGVITPHKCSVIL